MASTSTATGCLLFHTQCLAKLCRVCGDRITKGATRHPTSAYVKQFQNHGFQFDRDEKEVHPPYFCHRCFCNTLLRKASPKKTAHWDKHPRNRNCNICAFVISTSKGGCPKRTVKRGRPKSEGAPTQSSSTLSENPTDSDEITCTLDQTAHVSVPHLEQHQPDFDARCKHCNESIALTSITTHTCSTTLPLHHDHIYSKNTKQYDQQHHLSLKEKERVAYSVLQQKFKQSDDGVTAVLSSKNSGKQLCTKRVVRASMPNASASRSTKIKRAKQLSNMQETIDGQAAASSDTVPDGEFVKLSVDDMLELKTLGGMSWRKMKKIKKWLLEKNIRTPHEKGIRKLQADLIDGNLQGSYIFLQIYEESEKCLQLMKKPLISVINLQQKVFQLLDSYSELDELTWHDGGIPPDEVWIKLGGDKGGHSFKWMVQVANVATPNSLRNTQVMCLFPGSDSSFNMYQALADFREQVASLQTATWRGKNVRLFIFGDYEYLMKTYGLSGPSGRHCCLYCRIPKASMALPRASRPPAQERTLATMTASLKQYQQHQTAKEAFNVISEPLFEIPINQVCPPGLHISLGIFLKHFNSLEASCQKLDIRAAEVLATTCPSTPLEVHATRFQQVTQKRRLLHEVQQLETEKQDLMEQQLYLQMFHPDSQPVDLLSDTILEKDNDIKAKKNEAAKLPDLSEGQGPITKELDITLKKLHVQRQPFHGKSFVGNHVHKCLQDKNIDTLTSAIINKTEEVCPTLTRDATIVASRYNELFKRYSKCHRAMNTSTFLSSEDIDKLGEDITSYMEYVRSEFPTETITPKQHLLEDHVIPWLNAWHATMGLMGEQGGEAMHSHINNICSNLRGFSDDLAMYLSAVKNQWAHSNPSAYQRNKKQKY